MSIIYEALKKVESSPAKDIVKNGQPVIPGKPLAALSKKISPLFYAVIFICCAATSFIAFGAYFFSRNVNTVKNYPDKNQSVSNKKISPVETIRQEVAENSIKPVIVGNKPSSAQLPAYSLQGIVFDENSPFAVINGKTVKKSETVDDFTVVDIAPTSVTLKNSRDGKELTLSF